LHGFIFNDHFCIILLPCKVNIVSLCLCLCFVIYRADPKQNINSIYSILNTYLTEELFFLYCCAEWGYIVAFTKVLTMYQLYNTWIHTFLPLPFISHPSSPNSCKSFNRYHFCIYMHVHICCTVFPLLPPFPVTCPLPLVPTLPLLAESVLAAYSINCP
jgi:hypothetical protein